MTKNQFISRIVPNLLDAGISVQLLHKEGIEDCDGWFDPDDGQFIVACKGPDCDVFPAIVHEYCHFLQWRDDRPFWDKHVFSNGSMLQALDCGLHITNGMVRDSISLEHDCDIRVFEMISDLQLEIDSEQYARHSNIMLMMYHLVQTFDTWPHTFPGDVPEIKAMVPTHIKDVRFYQNPNNISLELLEKMIPCFVRP